MKPGRNVIERLVLAKHLYNHALTLCSKDTSIDISLSVIVLDNSVENYVWLIPFLPDSPARIPGDFKPQVELMAKLCKKINVNIETDAILQLHLARNSIQHSGTLLTRNQVLTFFTKMKELFNNCERMFGIKWDKVSLSALIQHKEVAAIFQQAELHRERSEFKDAANKFVIAFEKAKDYRMSNQFGSGMGFKRWNTLDIKYDSTETKLKNLHEFVDVVYSDLEILKMDLDYMKWRTYRLALGSLDPDEYYDYEIFKKSNTSKGENNITMKNNISISNADLAIEEEDDDTLDITKKSFKIHILEYTDEEIELWLNEVTPFFIETILYWQDNYGLFEISKIMGSTPLNPNT